MPVINFLAAVLRKAGLAAFADKTRYYFIKFLNHKKNSRYKKYIEGYFFNRLFMSFVTAKKEDGKYHFGYFERHYFSPKKKNPELK